MLRTQIIINHAIIHNRHGGNFKLTIEQIKEIRRSDLNNNQLAEKYKVKKITIYKIKNNQIWSNVK